MLIATFGKGKAMVETMKVVDGDVLIVIDVQNDFCQNGRLPVPAGDEVVTVINRLAERFSNVVLTQDWHPPGHSSFASTHAGRQAYETISLAYGEQVLWPDHCVQGTHGAEIHKNLQMVHVGLILRKGFHPAIDSYSAFFENDRKTPTGLLGYLRERGLSRVFLAGLAFDFCVRYSALDARRSDLATFVIADACRSIDVAGSAAETHRAFAAHGIHCLTSQAFA
jgi:nicotinamidase/pyrazinamidase